MTSVTDQSDMEQLDETSRAERRTQSRRSWMPASSSATKKRNSEQVGLGLAAAASPPLGATNPGADRSTSSIGSWHHASRSSPSDMQQFANDPANQPLSLDAEVSNNGATKEFGTEQPERRSLFGKFKAKVGLSRDGRDSGGSSERTKSPVTSEGPGKSGSSLALSPPPSNREPIRSTPAEGARTSEEPVQSLPVSPQLGSSMPPAIPEEPLSPESPVAGTAATTATTSANVESEAPAAVQETVASTSEPPSAPAVEQAAPEPAAESAAESAAEPAPAAEPAEPPK